MEGGMEGGRKVGVRDPGREEGGRREEDGGSKGGGMEGGDVGWSRDEEGREGWRVNKGGER